MGDVAREGRTVLFVSHDLTSVQVLCQRAIRLAKGRVQGIGSVSDEINAYMAESRAAAPSDLDHSIVISSDLQLTRFGFTPNPVPSGGKAAFHIELEATRTMRFDELAVLIHDTLGRRVGVVDMRQASGLHEARVGDNLRLTAQFGAVPLVEGEYRIGALIRSGDAQHIMHELVTLDVTASPDTDFVPYRTEIRGLVAFDYTVESPATRDAGVLTPS
jgi:lipopolysaccharide transport system ATP-binding protein